MIIKGIIDEDFINYRLPSMVIEFPVCDGFKCGYALCQNTPLYSQPNFEISCAEIVERYIKNDISQAIIFQGLEPFDSFTDMYKLIKEFRKNTQDTVVIYTGYTEKEIDTLIDFLKDNFKNIIIKFGRYLPNEESHVDTLLGIELASHNQYAKKIC